LRPAGSIMVGNKRIDAVSNGIFIDAGKTVRVVEVEGHRVVCEEAAGVPGQRQPA
jgi:membrane-bound serine protease (ClpP class)